MPLHHCQYILIFQTFGKECAGKRGMALRTINTRARNCFGFERVVNVVENLEYSSVLSAETFVLSIKKGPHLLQIMFKLSNMSSD